MSTSTASNEATTAAAQDGAASGAARESVTYVFLVRHGENEWVSSGKLAGRTPGVHLNEKGQQQADQIAAMLRRQPIAALYSSPLERCMETAQPLAAALGLPVCPEPGVLEVNYGDWHGRELKELSRLPGWHMVQHFPGGFRFPNGESLREVQMRAVDAVERLAAAHPNAAIAVFSHGDVIRMLVAHYAGTPLDLFQRTHVSTGSVSTVAISGAQDGSTRAALLNVNVQPEMPLIEFKAPQPENGSPDNGGAAQADGQAAQ